MSIDTIREAIAIEMNAHCDEIWWRILDNTNPGHYGVEDIEFHIDIKHIWIDIPAGTYTFKKGTLSFNAQLGSSNPDDGINDHFSKEVAGSGTFTLESGGAVTVDSFELSHDIDLYEPEK